MNATKQLLIIHCLPGCECVKCIPMNHLGFGLQRAAEMQFKLKIFNYISFSLTLNFLFCHFILFFHIFFTFFYNSDHILLPCFS